MEIVMEKPEEGNGMRLNKYLSDRGICSRRQADQYIGEGKVMIDGHTALMGERVLPGQQVIFCGKPVGETQEPKVLLAFHKPKGIVCTTSSRDKDNIVDFIGYRTRIYPIGRLDKDSEGLILLTNEGALSDQILRGSNYHEKEYVVTLNKDISDADLQRLREGVPVLDTVTRPCHVYRLDSNIFRIILTQGLNRQIRRMCEYLGYHVVYLKRIRIMNIMLDGIAKGKYREVTPGEWAELEQMLQDKTGEKAIEKMIRSRREDAFQKGTTAYRPERGGKAERHQRTGQVRKQNPKAAGKGNHQKYGKNNKAKRTDSPFK